MAAPAIAVADAPVEISPPGLPLAGAPNPGGQTIFIGEGGGIGIQPIIPIVFGQSVTTLPGDVVFLKDPLGGDAVSNFAAIVDFFNPADPSGSLGLPATEYQTYFGDNVGPTTFLNFKLAPNTIFLPQSDVPTPTPGDLIASYLLVGPAGAILSGQTAIFVVLAAPQPAVGGPDPQPISGAAPEPASWAMLLLGAGLIGGALRRSRPGLAAHAAGASGA